MQREEYSKALMAKNGGNGTRPWGVTGQVRAPFTNDREAYGYDYK